MTQEEALKHVARALAPESLTTLQIDIFRRAWNKQSYYKIAGELNHEYSYIKDVGAELWKLLSQALGIQVTKLNLQDVLTRCMHQQIYSLPKLPKHNRVDWGAAVDVSKFCGRHKQLALLEQWVMQARCRLVAIAGMGGIGKTMLATQLTQQLADTGQFEVVVWRSLKKAPPLVEFLTELMSAIAPQQSPPPQLNAKMRQLLEQLRHHRCLLILDNIETVMQGSALAGTYRPGYEDYGWLFQQLGAGRHQSTVLLTSREIPAEVAIQESPTALVRLLRLEPLSKEEGQIILATKGLIQAEQPQVRELIERYQGNPLALEIVATPIKELFDSNIAAFLTQEALLFKDLRELLAQQFNRLSALEQQVMYWLAINQEAVSAAQLQADLLPFVSPVELRDALVSLDRRSLIEKIKPTSAKPTGEIKLGSVSYTQQPVVMEYVTEQLIERVCQEVAQGHIGYLRSYALLKTQAKNYVRDVQMKLIVQPILDRLIEVQGGSENLKNRLLQLLEVQQSQAPLQQGYLAENTINLLRQLGADLSHLDLSNLTRQAQLRRGNWHGTNFSCANLSYAIFTQYINGILGVAFSPDAKRIPSERVQGKLHKHINVVLTAISADSHLLASGDEEEIGKICDRQTGECLKTLDEPQWQSSLGFAPSPQTPAESYVLASRGSDRFFLIEQP